MRVYILMSGDDEHQQPESVWDSQEAADRAKGVYLTGGGNGYADAWIEEMELQSMSDLTREEREK